MSAIGRVSVIEARNVARVLGIGIQVGGPVAQMVAFDSSMPAAIPSAPQDIESGRVSEIDVIIGAGPAYGRRVGVATPDSDMLVGLVKVWQSRFKVDER